MSIAKNKLVNMEDAQILYNDLRQRIESGGGGGGQQFMVTITEDSDALSSDKTATQIINAIEAGNTIYISYPDVYDTPTFALPLGYVNDPEGDGIGAGMLTLAGLTEWYVFDIRDDDGSTVVQVDSLNIEGEIDQLSGTIAPEYTSLSFPVAAGQLCYYNGGLYRAKQAIATSEAWTAAHWDSTTVEAELAGKGGAFVVTFSDSGSGYSVDKTYSEIKAAVDSGSVVVGKYYDNYYSLLALHPTSLSFAYTDQLGTEWFTVSTNNSVDHSYFSAPTVNYQIVATDYDNLTFPVAAGTYCTYEGYMFKANTAISTYEDFDDTKWDYTTVEAELNNCRVEVVRLI